MQFTYFIDFKPELYVVDDIILYKLNGYNIIGVEVPQFCKLLSFNNKIVEFIVRCKLIILT